MDSTNTEVRSFDDVKNMIEKESQLLFKEWSTEKQVKERLREYFSRYVSNLISVVMGFTYSFNRWEVDNCNGRSSALKELISDNVTREFQKVIEENIDSFKLTNDMKTAIQKEYNTRVAQSIRDVVMEKARLDVVTFVESLTLVDGVKVDSETKRLLNSIVR